MNRKWVGEPDYHDPTNKVQQNIARALPVPTTSNTQVTMSSHIEIHQVVSRFSYDQKCETEALNDVENTIYLET